MIRKFIFYAFLLLAGVELNAQHPEIARGTLPLEQVQQIVLPAQDNKSLLEEEAAARKPGRPNQFAVRVEVDIDPAQDGTWEVLPSGLAVWRHRIRSAGALSLNFGFSQYFMPEGGKLLIYSPDQKKFQGPFTLADNEDHAQLWTPIIYTDEVVLEVQVPQAKMNELALHLDYVHHDYIGLGLQRVASGSCNLDVICGAADGWSIVDNYRNIIQSAGAYTLGGTLTCSGALINNARNDCTPYFLTANHCGISNGNAASIVVYWNYQNSFCRQPNSSQSGQAGDGTLNEFNSGSVLRASYQETDFALIELDDPVDPVSIPFLAGWSREIGADSMIGIHHPGVEEKRISFDHDPNSYGSWFGNFDSTHVVVNDWDIGTTEGGSSGSPLFNQDRRIIGQLHGGGAACGNNDSDEYGWLHKSWEGGGTSNSRLKDWLDPDNTNVQFIDGKSCAYVIDGSPLTATVCNSATASTNFTITAGSGFGGPVTLSLPNLPGAVTGSFANNPIQPGASTQLTLNNLGGLAAGNYTISIDGTDGSNASSSDITLTINTQLPAATALSQPANGSTNLGTTIALSWAPQAGTLFDVEISTDPTFATVQTSVTGLSGNTYSAANLMSSTQYYWRVLPSNSCGQSIWTQPFDFTTGAVSCSTIVANNLPLTIDPGPPNNVTATLNYPNPGSITDVNVIKIQGTHTWLSDLTFTLTSPQGTSVVLVDQECGNDQNFDVGFDDQATGTLPCPYTDGMAYPAIGTLSDFIGENPMGNWTLEVADGAGQDGGSVDQVQLEICGVLTITSVENGLEQLELNLWPNPAQDMVKVALSSTAAANSRLEVLDLNGKKLLEKPFDSRANVMELDVKNLPAGYYLVRYADSITSKTKRLVLVK